jgi:glycyl-tRNA synthetase beta chain
MVGEFPELQGIMGAYYAVHDGEDQEVACAIEEHYRPRFAGDRLPESMTGTIVALADKLDTLVGIFGIGLLPTGDKDPFGLRRAALGVLRILIENKLPLATQTLLDDAANGLQGKINAGTQPLVAEFLLDRLRGYLREQGFDANEIEAVLATRPEQLNHDVLARLHAVRSFLALPEAASLAAANKRIANILKQADASNASGLDPNLFSEAAERQLADAIARVKPGAMEKFAKRDYGGTLQSLAALRAPVDAFFDQVMVMAEQPEVRANRIALLRELHGPMNQVADISRLAK